MSEIDPLISSETDPQILSDHNICRICLEEDIPENMIIPCRCTGHSKYVHVNCLNEWRATSNNREAFNRCFTCNYTYRTKVADKLSQCGILNFGHPKYYCGIYLLNFLAIMMIGYIAQQIDTTQQIPYFFNHYMDPSHWVGQLKNNPTGLAIYPPINLNNNITLYSNNNLTSYQINTTIITPDIHVSTIFDVFEYLTFGSYVYILLLLVLFAIKLVVMKNRCIYLKYIVGTPWYYGLFRVLSVVALTVVTLLTNPIVGCFVMTCIIQLIVRSHYHYVNEYYRAQSIIIVEYDPRYDMESRSNLSPSINPYREYVEIV